LLALQAPCGHDSPLQAYREIDYFRWLPLTQSDRHRRPFRVKTGKSRSEPMFSGLPPKADLRSAALMSTRPSAQKSPTDQYCYYTENAETPNVNVVVDLGENNKMVTPSNTPKGFDVASAFNRCVWFRTTGP